MVFIYGIPQKVEVEVGERGSVETDSWNDKSKMVLPTIRMGLLLIFNHDKFNVDGKGPRRGSERDVDLLVNSFKRIGFNIVVYINQTKDQIIDFLITRLKNETYDCVAVAVMTYGELGYLYASDTKYQEVEILECVQNNTRPETSKIFIFQASRTKSESPASTYEHPLSNAVVAHSTHPGYNSYSSTDQGSYFILGLCHQLDQHKNHERNPTLWSILECAKKNVRAECDKLNYTQEPQITYYEKNKPVSSIKSITFDVK